MHRIEIEIELDHPYDPELSDDISRRIHYLAEGIEQFELIVSGVQVAGVACVLRDGTDPGDVTRKVREGIARELDGVSALSPRALLDFDEPDSGSATPVLADALERGLVHRHGPGQVGLAGVLVELLECLDELLRARLRRHGAEELRLPVLLEKAVLKQSGYFDSFPQHVMFVDRLRADYDLASAFSEASRSDDSGEMDDYLERASMPSVYALPPTVCYLIYETIKQSNDAANRMFTARGASFRFESEYHDSMARLWDFTIRETVIFGARPYVEERLAEVRESIVGLVQLLRLPGRCVTATDPFFMTTTGAQRTNLQRLASVKSELQLRLDSERTIAVASFNRHGDYMSRRFDLPKEGTDGPPVTACVGVGLERLVFAFIAQHGLEEEAWPPAVRTALAGRRHYLASLQELV